MAEQAWEVRLVDEVLDWMDSLEPNELKRVVDAINALEENGPSLGRPTVDTISNSTVANLKELRPGTVRILFVFDPYRSAILLVAGDKSGKWNRWYDTAIPMAEERYKAYLKERADEEKTDG